MDVIPKGPLARRAFEYENMLRIKITLTATGELRGAILNNSWDFSLHRDICASNRGPDAGGGVLPSVSPRGISRESALSSSVQRKFSGLDRARRGASPFRITAVFSAGRFRIPFFPMRTLFERFAERRKNGVDTRALSLAKVQDVIGIKMLLARACCPDTTRSDNYRKPINTTGTERRRCTLRKINY